MDKRNPGAIDYFDKRIDDFDSIYNTDFSDFSYIIQCIRTILAYVGCSYSFSAHKPQQRLAFNASLIDI